MIICPKCGNDTFNVTAHVTQLWKVDGNREYLETLVQCEEVTHRPDMDDVWCCEKCGFDFTPSSVRHVKWR